MFSFRDTECQSHADLQPRQARGDIILIGMMGCGKTTIGRNLSIDLERPLLDMDSLIEEQIGKSIPDIFREEGEAHFRSLETALLRYLVEGKHSPAEGCVLSTGGGVPLRLENRELMCQLGFIVWLRVELDVLCERTMRSNHRPLLEQADCLQERLASLCEARYPIYEQTAHYIIDSTRKDVGEVTDEIKLAAQRYFDSL